MFWRIATLFSQNAMGQNSGVCRNFGRCRKADAWESIAIAGGGSGSCPECGGPLTLSSGVRRKGGLRYVVLALAAALLCLTGVFVYLTWSCCAPPPGQDRDRGANPPPKPPDPESAPVPAPAPAPGPVPGEERETSNKPSVPTPAPMPDSLPAATAKPAILRARLLSTISTKTSKETDPFAAKVEGGPYNGAVLAGHITRIERKKKQSKIGFQFETIALNGRQVPIQADVKDVTNAKGTKGVDEENRVIGSTSKKKAFLLGTVGGAIGGVWGAIKGGRKGAAVGAASGAGAGVILGLTVVAEGNDIHFVPGTLFTIEASEGRAK